MGKTKEECLQIMKKITNKAREEGCLLELPGDRVFTPDELDAHNQQGEFIWANWSNWVLLTPSEYLVRKARQLDNARLEYEDAYAKVTEFIQALESGKKGTTTDGQ